MDLDKAKQYLEAISKAAAAAALTVYVVGFLVISFHHSRLGIPQFSFLRPKMFSAGVLFLFFLALPLIELTRIVGLWGVAPRSQSTTDAGPSNAKDFRQSIVYRAHSFLFLSVAMSFFLGSVTLDHFEVGAHELLWGLVFASIGILCAIFVRFRHRQQTTTCFLVVLAGTLGMLFAVWQIQSAGIDRLVLWFCIVAVAYLAFEGERKTYREEKRFHLHLFVFFVIGVIAFFAIFLYPLVRPYLGGGAPLPATIQVTDDALLDGRVLAEVRLIDETEDGFYILKTANASKALFIPRAYVKSVFFGTQEDTAAK